MGERVMLKGVLAEKKQVLMRLATRAENRIKTIRSEARPGYVTPLSEIDPVAILEAARELADIHREYTSVSAEVEKLRREVGD